MKIQQNKSKINQESAGRDLRYVLIEPNYDIQMMFVFVKLEAKRSRH